MLSRYLKLRLGMSNRTPREKLMNRVSIFFAFMPIVYIAIVIIIHLHLNQPISLVSEVCIHGEAAEIPTSVVLALTLPFVLSLAVTFTMDTLVRFETEFALSRSSVILLNRS